MTDTPKPIDHNTIVNQQKNCGAPECSVFHYCPHGNAGEAERVPDTHGTDPHKPAREHIMALEAEHKADAEACAKATWTAVVLVTERDAALARVRELEAAAQPKPRDERLGTDDPAPAPAPKCTCAEDLRAAAGMLRRTTRTIDPPTTANCRIAAGYDAAAAWLDSPEAAPAADPEGGAPPEANP